MPTRSVESYLAVGSLVVLHVNPKSSLGFTIKTRIRGWDRDHYILLDWPADTSKCALLRPNVTCSIKFVSNGEACGVMTTITDPGSSRDPRIRVAWPRTIEVVGIRKFFRVNVSSRCSMTVEDGTSYETELFDISSDGCGVYLQAPLERGTQLTLSFTLPDGQRFDELHAIIRGAFTFDHTPVAGCQFVQLDPAHRLALEFFTAMSEAASHPDDQGVERVIVLHDDLKTLLAIRKNLEEAEYRVTAMRDILDSVCLMRMSPPTAVVIQADHSQLAGTQLCQLIRASRALSGSALVLCGGHEKLVGPQLESLGANGYIGKPEDAARVVRESTQVPAESA